MLAVGITLFWLQTLGRRIQVAADLGWYQLAPAIPTRWRPIDDRSPRTVVGLIVAFPDGNALAAASEVRSLRTLVLTHPSEGPTRFYPAESHDPVPWQLLNGALAREDTTQLDLRLENDDLRHLSPLTDLRILQLDSQPIDDGCIPHLLALKSLERLSIRKTRISQTGMDRLRAGLPEAAINAESPFGPFDAVAPLD